ncbi:MAG: GldG family protein [Stellaceae bacterium]
MIALICIGLILVSANIIASRFFTARLDLTQDHLYTLSRGTRLTLAKIAEPITLRFYYSTHLGDSLPGYGVYAARVRQLLDQYVIAAHGKIRLEVYNPLPFSSEEDQAVGFGLQGVPLNQAGEQVYFGLAGTNSTDDIQVIPFFSRDRERFLEYDLTRLIHTLAFPKRTVVGLLSSLPLEGDPMAAMRGLAARPMAVIDQLRQLDDVDDLTTALTSIPAGIDVLMVVQPQNLPDKALFAIDQYVLKGGKALIFVDPYSELQASLAGRAQNPKASNASNLEPLFKAWGVRLVPNVVAGDRGDARRVGVPVPGRAPVPMDYVAWLNLRPPNLNRTDPITADLDRINVATAGILEPIAGAKTRMVPLITTSRDSEKIPVAKVEGLPNVGELLTHFRPGDTRYIIAAHVTGMVTSAFPGGPPDAGPPSPHIPKSARPHYLKKSAVPINAVVVADTDMLDDRFWAQTRDFYGQRVVVPNAGNGDFVENAVEVLAGGEDLVGLRSRGSSARPFVVVERIQRAADEQYAARQQALQQKLKETQAKLRNLTGGGGGNPPATLSPEQTRTIAQFRADMVATRQQLRAVQAALRRDISRLKLLLEFADIAMVPILISAIALVAAALRIKRRRRRGALV